MGIYQNLYNLIVQYVYGNNVPADGELIATLIATAGSIFVVALPFLVVWKVIKLIGGF